MTPSWDGLRLLLAVTRAGSISAAADELGVPQSSVSEQIARLEREFGHRLLERSSAGVRPTPRGRGLLSRVSEPLDRLTAAMAIGESGEDRTVFLGGPAEFLSAVVLPGLTGRLPAGVRVSTRFGLAEELAAELRSGAIDVLVSPLPVRGTDVAAEPIYDEEFHLVAHPEWLPLAEEDLESIPVLAYGPELPIVRRYWRSVFGHRPDALKAAVTAPDLRTLLGLALSGAGMSVLPDYLVHTHLSRGELVNLHSPELAPLNTLFVASRRSRRAPDPLLIDVCAAIAATAENTAATMSN